MKKRNILLSSLTILLFISTKTFGWTWPRREEPKPRREVPSPLRPGSMPEPKPEPRDRPSPPRPRER